MPDQQLLARTYHEMLMGFVREGRALHFTELAEVLGINPWEARQVQRDLAQTGLAIWMEPETDYVAALLPFSSIPTQTRIAVDSEQKWYAI